MKINRKLSSDSKVTRTRSANFTDDDRRMLVQLIGPFVGIVENKNAEKSMCIMKKEAWAKITVLYNGQSDRATRTQSQLKLCYEAIKYKMRRSELNNQESKFSGRLSKITGPTVEQHATTTVTSVHRDGDAVLLDIDAQYFANAMAKNSGPVEMKGDVVQVKLEEPDSDDCVMYEPVHIPEIENCPSKTCNAATQTMHQIRLPLRIGSLPVNNNNITSPVMPQSSSMKNQIRRSLSSPTAPANALIALEMRCLYEQQAMKREQHKLKMQLLREQLKRSEDIVL